jgi:hypothetical protein
MLSQRAAAVGWCGMSGRPPVRAILAMLALAAPLVVLMGGRSPGTHGAGAAGGGAGSGDRAGALRAPTGPRLAVDRAGPGTIELPGVVVDAAGAPVEAVAITAELEAVPSPSDADDVAVIATTGADGRFTLRGLVAGRHRLAIEGDAIFTAEVRFVPVPSDQVRIVVARRVAIAGRVTDAGAAMANATVELAGDAITGRRRAITGADGGFAFDELPEGTYQVWAWQGDLAARTQRVPRLGAGPFTDVELAVEPATIVVGHVVDRDAGTGVAAAVELRPAGADAEATRYARAGVDGVFRIEGVPHGRWIADAWSPGWVTAGTVELEAGRGMPSIELIAGGVIEGRVVDAAGAPIAGAAVRAAGREDGVRISASARDDVEQLRRYSGWSQAVAAPEPAAAAAALADPSADPRFVPRGELGVLLGPIPYPPPPGAAAARQAAIVEPGIAGPGAAAGGLRGVPGDLVEPEPLPGADPARASIWITDADGRFRIAGLPRATVTVFATAPGFAEGASDPIAAAPARVIADVAVVLAVGLTIVGRVTDQRGDPVIGASLSAAPRDGRDADPARRIEAMSGTDGAYRLGPVTGAITLTATAYAHGDARVELDVPAAPGTPPELRQDLVLVVADAVLTGTVDDAAGLPVRGATVSIAAGPAAGRSAVTTEAGFRIELLPPGALTVRIDHPDYPIAQLETSTEGIAHLTLPWGGGIDGLVIDHHTGAPVGGVVVAATGPGGDRDETAVAPSGAFELGPLAPGAWTLAIAQPGYLPIERTVDVPIGDRAGAITVRDLRLELERGALLAGTVRDRYGTRLAGAMVTVERAAAAAGTSSAPVTARTDADGQFRIRDAPTGALRLRGTKDRLAGTVELTVAPGDELLGVDLELR